MRCAHNFSLSLLRDAATCTLSIRHLRGRPSSHDSTRPHIMDPEPDERQTRELQAFMETQNQKAVIQAAIGKLTETCFDKCIDKPGNKLDSYEANCIANCAARYLDSSVFVVNRMMAKQGQ